MALISCFTGPEGLQGVLTCLRDTEGLTGILVVVGLLTGWLVVQYLAGARRERRAWESRPGMPVPPAQFGSARHAESVHAFANRELYQAMLRGLENGLTETGYELTRDRSRRVVAIPLEDRLTISRWVFRARQWYTSPRMSEQRTKDIEDDAVNDGYAGMLLNVLIRGCDHEGWYITEPVQEFAPTSFPLKQVAINVRATQAVLTRDVVSIINDVAEKVRMQSSFPHQPTCIVADVMNSELNYEVRQQEIDEPPGWFNSPAGCELPDDITEGHFPLFMTSGHRHFIVRVQGGRFYTQGTLAFFIEQAAHRIAQGEISGACYEDDSGYAFAVIPAKATH